MRTVILDQGFDTSVADAVTQLIDELGFSSEEAIPGLVRAIILLSEFTSNPEAAMDEASNLLADGAIGRD